MSTPSPTEPIVWTQESAWAATRLPVERASALHAACYTDASFFGLEQDRVFATSWVCIGVAEDLGDGRRLLVRQVADQSIIVIRNPHGELRGFRNACRHRGTELASEDCAIGTTIRCPYHRWGYNLDGALVATPRFAEATVEDFDPTDFGLHTVRVGEWGGLLFVCLDPDTAPLAVWLGDLPERMAGYGLDAWTARDRCTVEIAANWKLVSENFQEYYHLTWVHPELAKVSRVEDHYRYQGPGMYCGQTTTPVSSDERNDWEAMPPAADLRATDARSGRFIALFPNVMLSVLPNHVCVMILRPIAPDVTEEELIWLLPPTGTTASTAVAEEDFATTRSFWVDVNDEDVAIVARSQRGLSAGGYTPGRLSPRFEEPLHRFHNMLADRLIGVNRIPEGDGDDSLDRYGSGVNPLPYTPAEPAPHDSRNR